MDGGKLRRKGQCLFNGRRKRKRRRANQPNYFSPFIEERRAKKNFSPAGNRTPVFRVTGGDTYHYTTEEAMMRYEMMFKRVLIAYDHTTLNAPVLV